MLGAINNAARSNDGHGHSMATDLLFVDRFVIVVKSAILCNIYLSFFISSLVVPSALCSHRHSPHSALLHASGCCLV